MTRRPSLIPLLTGAALLLSGCAQEETAAPQIPTATHAAVPTSADVAGASGSSVADASGGSSAGASTSTSSSSASISTSPEPVASPPASGDSGSSTSAPGGSELSSDPRIAAVQRWARGYAKAATAGDPDLKAWLRTMGPKGKAQRVSLIQDELGWTYFGPLPFTETAVVDRSGADGIVAAVEACVMTKGFAKDPQGEVAQQEVMPIEFHLSRSSTGDLVVDGVYRANSDCSNVLVEGKSW